MISSARKHEKRMSNKMFTDNKKEISHDDTLSCDYKLSCDDILSHNDTFLHDDKLSFNDILHDDKKNENMFDCTIKTDSSASNSPLVDEVNYENQDNSWVLFNNIYSTISLVILSVLHSFAYCVYKCCPCKKRKNN